MEKIDHTGKAILVSKKQQIDIASSPITSIEFNQTDIKLISNLVKKYTQVNKL